MFEDTMSLTTPLEWIPVLATCGHFQLVLTRWHGEINRARQYLLSGMECTVCNACGRSERPKFDTLAEAQAEAEANPHRPPQARLTPRDRDNFTAGLALAGQEDDE